ncbi:MAG: hypothetical protein NWP91_02165 [Rickettsiaceae bacterium]|nr:hypothetical protein [Rickettsiaceae bacterium]
MTKVMKDRVLETLQPMYNVILNVEKNGRILVLKDDIKFAFIEDKNIFFIDQRGQFEKAAHDLLDNADDFLREATKAFWYARSLEDEA